MSFSAILIPAMAISLLIGFAALVAAIWLGLGKSEDSSWTPIVTCLLIALIVNSWWIALFAIVFFKFYILGQDT